ncbi:unnamed protein product, partial [Notodromas monacha]
MSDASVSRQLSQAIVSQLIEKHPQAQVEYLDLATQPIPHLDAEILMGQNAEQSALGLAGDKKAYIASSRGGVYGDNSPVDFQE